MRRDPPRQKPNRELARQDRQRQRRKSTSSNAGRFAIYDADGSEVLIVTDKPIGRGNEPLCLRGCNCKPCRVRRYASALVEKGHPTTQFIVDPKADGFWIRSRRRTWAFMSFRSKVGLAKPEIAEAAAAALTEPLKLMDVTGSDKRLYAAAVRRARNAQRNMRIASEAPQFFSADLMMDVAPPCEICPQGIIICCDEPFPTTLTATFAAASCAALDGISLPLSYVGELFTDVHAWEASINIEGCGDCTFRFQINNGIACEWAMGIQQDSSGTDVWGCFDTDCDQGSISCPFESAEYTAGIPACASSMTCVGNLTVTVAA